MDTMDPNPSKSGNPSGKDVDWGSNADDDNDVYFGHPCIQTRINMINIRVPGNMFKLYFWSHVIHVVSLTFDIFG